MAHVISTAHSPVPQGHNGFARGSPPPRAGSPLSRQVSPGQQQELASSGYSGNLQAYPADNSRGSVLTPRSGSGRRSPGQNSPINPAMGMQQTQASVEVE